MRLDISASGCNGYTSATVTVTGEKAFPGGVSAGDANFTVVALIFTPNGSFPTAGAPFDIMYQQDSSNNLWLAVTGYPLGSCTTNNPGDGGSTSMAIKTTWSNGGLTSSNPPTSTWMTAAQQFVGQTAQLAQGLAGSVIGCQQNGLVYDPVAMACTSPSSITNGGVTETIATIAVNGTASSSTRTVVNVPSLGQFGVVGSYSYNCVPSGGAGQQVWGTGSLSLIPASPNAQTLVSYTAGSDTNPPLAWTTNTDSTGAASYALILTAAPGMDCVVSARTWSAVTVGSTWTPVTLNNPSWEQGFAGWNNLGGCGTWTGWTNPVHYTTANQQAFDGNQIMYCNGPGAPLRHGGVWQSTGVQVQANSRYRLTFWAMKR